MCFDQMMIQYSAPTLCDIKPGNLFSIKNVYFSNSLFRKWENEFCSHGLSTAVVDRSQKTKLVLVYNRTWVHKILSDKSVQSYLDGKGYKIELGTPKIIRSLLSRIKQGTNFPHEIGVILGYPVEDVIAFEKFQGQQCKYCGYWKSYSDVEKARQCQCRYKCCSGMCKKMFDAGYSVHQIIEKYKVRYSR